MEFVDERSMQGLLLDRRPLVLIVEDDGRSAGLLARMLRLDGYDTEVTTDGATALARLTREPVPDALVTDYHLPHANGLAVGRYARSRRPGIPVFVVTGYPQALERASVWGDAPFQVLIKPLDYDDLVHRLGAALIPRAPDSEAP
jgi:two-component system response regulator MprA